MKRLICSALALVASVAIAADEKVPPTEELTLRVTGLFDSAREGEFRAVLEKVPSIALVRLDYEFAEATFRLNPDTGLKNAKPEELPKKLDEQVRAASHNTFGIKPRQTLAREKLSRVEIGIGGVDCRACALAAYECVASLDGVAAATASFHESKMTALIDPEKTTREKLVEALKRKNVGIK